MKKAKTEKQIVYGIIQFEAIAKQDQSKVEQILQQFTQQMDGHLITLNPLQYSFITTRGQLERETLGYKHLPPSIFILALMISLC